MSTIIGSCLRASRLCASVASIELAPVLSDRSAQEFGNRQAQRGFELTFISGYTNGYIYYLPTAEQLRNPGHAQEDCDTLIAPEWQAIFEARALGILRRL
jgi:hypothetical protein